MEIMNSEEYGIYGTKPSSPSYIEVNITGGLNTLDGLQTALYMPVCGP